MWNNVKVEVAVKKLIKGGRLSGKEEEQRPIQFTHRRRKWEPPECILHVMQVSSLA